MSDEQALSELVRDVVDQGATTVEEIHRAVAELPLNVLERIGLFERTAEDVRKIPAAALSNADADLLETQVATGRPVRFRLELGCRMLSLALKRR